MRSNLTILLLVIPLLSFSQSKFELGLQAGGGFTKFTNSNRSLIPSYHFGGSISYPLGEKTYLKTNILYSGLNFKDQILLIGGITDENDFTKTRLGYIQLPFSYNLSSKTKAFDLGFGTSFDFLVNEKATTILYGQTSEEFDTGYNNFQFDLFLELNFVVNKTISIYAKYQQSLTPFTKDENYQDDRKAINFNLGLNYKLN